MKIVVIDDYQDVVRKLECAKKLEKYPIKVYTNTVKGLGQLSVRLKDAEILVLIRERTQITKALLEKLPKLKMISQTGKISSHLDLKACTDRGIVVSEGYGSPFAPAEMTWALVLAASRRLPQYISNLRHGVWQQSGLKSLSHPKNFGLGTVLHGKTMGIWGYGKIGQMVSQYAKAFGMQVMVWGSDASRKKAVEDGFIAASSKASFFEHVDVLSIHLRLNDETRGIVKASDLALMKKNSLFVNTSRAELVQNDALSQALSKGRPGLGAVDVFESEPILQGHTLLKLENCICTPHIGYVEEETYELYFGTAFDNVLNFIKGQPSAMANPEALHRKP
ncbi:MAG: D-2-hydroxyacid dehydrogenase family protein [Betaproteobacteria bacterium]